MGMYLGQTEVAQDDLEHFMKVAAKFEVKGLTGENLFNKFETEEKFCLAAKTAAQEDTNESYSIQESEYSVDEMVSTKYDNEALVEYEDLGSSSIKQEDNCFYCDQCSYK